MSYTTELDHRRAFDLAPVGLVISRHRIMVDCNQQLCSMFAISRELVIGQSFQLLYPSAEEYERSGRRIAPILNAKGSYSDNRIMKRATGEAFWCRVNGRALDRLNPHAEGIWSFEDLSEQRPIKSSLTGREREVAAKLLEGLTSKEIGRTLGISHRTVEIYRSRLMRKYDASTTGDLVLKLLAIV